MDLVLTQMRGSRLWVKTIQRHQAIWMDKIDNCYNGYNNGVNLANVSLLSKNDGEKFSYSYINTEYSSGVIS